MEVVKYIEGGVTMEIRFWSCVKLGIGFTLGWYLVKAAAFGLVSLIGLLTLAVSATV